ncbi:MAG: lipoyl synthase [Proteobacteria bacterium]|nr:lipoyl synthase [Pseudomonadota bacterium]
MSKYQERKPDWLKIRLPEGRRYQLVRHAVSTHRLHTVCQEAHCPNIGACWDSGAATFMILGDVCTRGCGFCAVRRDIPISPIDKEEPLRVAKAVQRMELDYAVVTSVTRDDLPDGGASVFAKTVRAIKSLASNPRVELLIPDYLGEELDVVLASGADVLAHNIEVVECLTPHLRHARFSYRRSLRVLEGIARRGQKILAKSSIMLGLGETDLEIEAAMHDLREVGVDILVLGQYLSPSKAHAEVKEYVPPDRFDALATLGKELGFGYVIAGPLVRTSYKAAEAYARHSVGPPG